VTVEYLCYSSTPVRHLHPPVSPSLSSGRPVLPSLEHFEYEDTLVQGIIQIKHETRFYVNVGLSEAKEVQS